MLTEVGNFFQTLTDKLSTQREEHHQRLVGAGDADQTFQRISNLFSANVGIAFTEEELTPLFEEGKTRYEKKIPPGYKDKDDSNPNQYGDLVIWKEILRLGADKKLPIIFVTDDAKEDWWWKHGGETQGPRVELVDEYWSHAERRIHFYEPLRFLQYAKNQTNTQVSVESLEEVEEVSSANSRVQRVLRERKENLEAQRARIMRRFEGAQSKQIDASGIHKIHDEYSALASQEQAIKAHLQSARQRADSLMASFSDHTIEADRQESLQHFTELSKEVEMFEGHLSSLTRNRETLERQLHRGSDHDHRLMRSLERQLGQLQEELQDVDLALEELNE